MPPVPFFEFVEFSLETRLEAPVNVSAVHRLLYPHNTVGIVDKPSAQTSLQSFDFKSAARVARVAQLRVNAEIRCFVNGSHGLPIFAACSGAGKGKTSGSNQGIALL